MKNIIIISTIAILFSCKKIQEERPEIDFLENEIISLVYMTPNNKTLKEIDDFSEYYQNRMKELEPDVLSWKFLRSVNNKVILIERYKNEGAIFNHIKNVSPEGILEKDFGQFMDHFVIDSITYYGDLTNKFKSTISEFGIKTIYFENISGFSK